MTAGSSKNVEDDDIGYISTHKEIERRDQINQCNLIETPFIENNVVLDNDSNDYTEEADDQIPSSPQPTVNLDNLPSAIEIVKGSILYNVSDVPQGVESENTPQPMSDAATYANLDKKQHQAFKIICCTFMLSWLDELYTKENH
eukprot:3123593-Ditylum_brightwellii.AAC.1